MLAIVIKGVLILEHHKWLLQLLLLHRYLSLSLIQLMMILMVLVAVIEDHTMLGCRFNLTRGHYEQILANIVTHCRSASIQLLLSYTMMLLWILKVIMRGCVHEVWILLRQHTVGVILRVTDRACSINEL
jgi:hypothetical protein